MIEFLKQLGTGLGMVVLGAGIIGMCIVGVGFTLINYPWILLGVIAFLLSWNIGYDYRKRKQFK